jgi:hypothetical protein
VIKILNDDYSMRLLCETLGVHRCYLYHEPRLDEDQPIKDALLSWPVPGLPTDTVA